MPTSAACALQHPDDLDGTQHADDNSPAAAPMQLRRSPGGTEVLVHPVVRPSAARMYCGLSDWLQDGIHTGLLTGAHHLVRYGRIARAFPWPSRLLAGVFWREDEQGYNEDYMEEQEVM